MDISWCILILIIVCLVVVGIIGSITGSKENRGREMSCKTDRECSPFNVSLELTAPKEDISLPTHCLNVLDKDEHRCVWLWPEGLYEVIDLDGYIDSDDPSTSITTNLRDWMKSRKQDLYTTIDLNKLPQHHQTVEIVDEGMCPFPFMDFISLGSRDIEKVTDTLSEGTKKKGILGELNQEIAEEIQRASRPRAYKKSISKEIPDMKDQKFGVCAVSPDNISRVLAHLEPSPMVSIQGSLTRFRHKK